VRALKAANATDEEARKQITDFLQEKLQQLKVETEALHFKYFKTKS